MAKPRDFPSLIHKVHKMKIREHNLMRRMTDKFDWENPPIEKDTVDDSGFKMEDEAIDGTEI